MGTYLRWALIRIGYIFEVGTFRGGYLFEVGTYLTLGAYSNKFGNISRNFFKLFFFWATRGRPSSFRKRGSTRQLEGRKKKYFWTGLGWGVLTPSALSPNTPCYWYSCSCSATLLSHHFADLVRTF